MNSTNLEFNIPAAIADLPLTIAEKVALAHIAKFPGCSNTRLAKLIGVTCRGVENLLRRLRQQGYIEQSGKGRARRHQLLFRVEHHIMCGDGDDNISKNKSHTSCGDKPDNRITNQSENNFSPLQRELSWEEELDQTLDLIHELCVYHDPFPELIVNLYDKILTRLVDEGPECPAKDALVGELTKRRDAFVAIDCGSRLPRKYQSEAARLIRKATPGKLAEFRKRLKNGQLGENAPLMLATLAPNVDIVPPGNARQNPS